jgi:hypothetical protein
MEPHPDQDEQPEARTPSRGAIVAAIVIGLVFLVIVVLHLTGAMALHSR